MFSRTTARLLYREGEGRKLLLHAICDRAQVRVAGRLREIKRIVPLVCDQVWSLILTRYPHSPLKVLVEQNRPTSVLQRSSLFSCFTGKTLLIYSPTRKFRGSIFSTNLGVSHPVHAQAMHCAEHNITI